MKKTILLFVFIFIGWQNTKAQCFPDRHSSTWHESWISCEVSSNPNTAYGDSHWILYDFGFDYTLYHTNIWNLNETDNLNNGINQYSVDYSSDGTIWTHLGEYTANQADGLTTYEGEPGPDFEGVSAHYVLLTPLSNHGGTCYGISEIKFFLDDNEQPDIVDDTVFTNEDTAIVISVLDNDSDPDGTINMTSLIEIIAPSYGTISIDSGTGVITYSPELNFNGTDSFKYQVCDNAGACDTAIVTITIEPINDTPYINNDADAAPENNPVTTTVLANDNDVDDPVGNIDLTSVSIVSDPTNGSVVVNLDGTITYMPNVGYVGIDTYVYSVCDDGNPTPALCGNATVTITVENFAPVTTNDSATTNEEISVLIDVLANDIDLDGTINSTTVTEATAPSNGSISIDGASGVINYTPSTNFNGIDSFEYQVCDDDAACSTGMVIITVAPINDTPFINDDIFTVPDNTVSTLDILENDADTNDPIGNIDYFSVTIISDPTHGSAEVTASGDVTYTPDTDYVGVDSFMYTVCDDGNPLPALCGDATVNITVTDAIYPPEANDDAVLTDEDTPIDINVTANDLDIDGTIDVTTVSLVTAPLNGSTAIDGATGQITYTPNLHFNETDSFEYQVCDDDSACDTAFVSIAINPINDVPIVNNDTDTTLEDIPVTTLVLDNDTDLNDPLGNIDPTTVSIAVAPANGVLMVSAEGAITYTPNADFDGEDTYVYSVCDDGNPMPAQCANATVTITVTNLINAPEATNDETETNEDNLVIIDILDNDTDPDGTIDSTSVTEITPPTNGNIIINGVTGEVTYTPNLNYNGTDSFVYQVCDNDAACDTATVTITINPINDAPTINDDTDTTIKEISTTTFVLENDIDEFDPLGNINSNTVTIISDPDNGSVVVNDDGSITYTPDIDFDGEDSYEYNVCDDGFPLPALCGNATVTISIADDIGVSEHSNFKANVFPNPFSDQFVIVTSNVNIGELLTYKVYDLLGRLVTETKIITTYPIHRVAIDMKNMQSGLYMVEVKNGAKEQVLKVVKK